MLHATWRPDRSSSLLLLYPPLLGLAGADGRLDWFVWLTWNIPVVSNTAASGAIINQVLQVTELPLMLLGAGLSSPCGNETKRQCSSERHPWLVVRPYQTCPCIYLSSGNIRERGLMGCRLRLWPSRCFDLVGGP